MSEHEPEVGEGWDADKVHAHLADLRERQTRERAIYDAFTDAAEQHDREADRIGRQIAHCLDQFGKPRPTTQATEEAPRD